MTPSHGRRSRETLMKPHPKVVTAFTHADDDRWLPPRFVVGELVVRHVPALAYDQYLVDGVGVDADTVVPLTRPTPELLRALKRKSAAWALQDRALAEARAREDDGFREDHVDEEYEVHLVREDQQETFAAFCDRMEAENQRLTAERRAAAAELVRRHARAAQ